MECNCDNCFWSCKHEEGCDFCSDFISMDGSTLEDEASAYAEYRDAWNAYVRDFD